MRNQQTLKTKTRVTTLGLIALLCAAGTAIADPIQIESGPLSDSVMRGEKLFASEKFGGTKACSGCHNDGGKTAGALPDGKKVPPLNNAAAIFPRHNPRQDKIFTLSDQIRHCIKEVKGTPPDYGSAELNALVSYVSSLAEGQAIDLGGKPK